MTMKNRYYDQPIAFDGENVLFSSQDEDLLGLTSPAPVDTVADRAFEYVGRYVQYRGELSDAVNELSDELGAAQKKTELLARISRAEADVARLQEFCQTAGMVALHNWLDQPF